MHKRLVITGNEVGVFSSRITWNQHRFPISIQEQRELNSALGRLALLDIDSGGSRFRLQKSFISEELGNPDDKNSLFYKAWKLSRVIASRKIQAQVRALPPANDDSPNVIVIAYTTAFRYKGASNTWAGT